MKSKHGIREFLSEWWPMLALYGVTSVAGLVLGIANYMNIHHAIWTALIAVFVLLLLGLYGLHLQSKSLEIAERLTPEDVNAACGRSATILEYAEHAKDQLGRVLALAERANSVATELYVSQESIQMFEDSDGNYKATKPLAVMIYVKLPPNFVQTASTAVLGFEHPAEFRFSPSYPVGVLPAETFSHRRKAHVPIKPGVLHILLPSPEIPKDKAEPFRKTDKTLVITLDCENPPCRLRQAVQIEGLDGE